MHNRQGLDQTEEGGMSDGQFVHLLNNCNHHPPVMACIMKVPKTVDLTHDRSKVTCGECKKTHLFRFGKWMTCPTRPCCGCGIWTEEEEQGAADR